MHCNKDHNYIGHNYIGLNYTGKGLGDALGAYIKAKKDEDVEPAELGDGVEQTRTSPPSFNLHRFLRTFESAGRSEAELQHEWAKSLSAPKAP